MPLLPVVTIIELSCDIMFGWRISLGVALIEVCTGGLVAGLGLSMCGTRLSAAGEKMTYTVFAAEHGYFSRTCVQRKRCRPRSLFRLKPMQVM